MITVKSFAHFDVKDNYIYVDPSCSQMENSNILFRGKGNILFVEDGVSLCNSYIDFSGDNGLLYISRTWHKTIASLLVRTNSTVYIGCNNYFNQSLQCITAERENILIGNNNLFAQNITIRTTDTHLIYDIQTKERLNYSKSVLIGDHVWVGLNAQILKGALIGLGAIVGAGAIVTGKKILSNSLVAGNPANLLKKGVFWKNDSVNEWTETQTEASRRCEEVEYIYKKPRDGIAGLEEINGNIKELSNPRERLSYIQKNLVKVSDKNRFYIS